MSASFNRCRITAGKKCHRGIVSPEKLLTVKWVRNRRIRSSTAATKKSSQVIENDLNGERGDSTLPLFPRHCANASYASNRLQSLDLSDTPLESPVIMSSQE